MLLHYHLFFFLFPRCPSSLLSRCSSRCPPVGLLLPRNLPDRIDLRSLIDLCLDLSQKAPFATTCVYACVLHACLSVVLPSFCSTAAAVAIAGSAAAGSAAVETRVRPGHCMIYDQWIADPQWIQTNPDELLPPSAPFTATSSVSLSRDFSARFSDAGLLSAPELLLPRNLVTKLLHDLRSICARFSRKKLPSGLRVCVCPCTRVSVLFSPRYVRLQLRLLLPRLLLPQLLLPQLL